MRLGCGRRGARRRLLPVLGATALVLQLAAASGAAVSEVTYGAAADTYASSKNPTTTHGTATYLKVEGGSTVRNAYLRFAVTGAPTAPGRKLLRLFALTSSSVGFSVRAVSANSWGETTLTYSNAPPFSATVTASSGAFAANTWVSLDVSSLVAGDGTYSFALTTTGGQIQLATRERGATSVPTLVFEAPPEPPVNTSPPTISGTAQERSILTANPGAWSGTQPIAYSYRWQVDEAGGWTNIPTATSSTFRLTADQVGHTVRVVVTASNSVGSSTATSSPTAVVTPAPPRDPVVMAAGDIACSDCADPATSDLLVAENPDAVLALGDLQYDCGRLSEFQADYDLSWGRVKAATYPAPGNHEYQTSAECAGAASGAPGYYTYFGGAASPLDPGCTVSCRGYYSFDVGAWHLVALNSECSAVGGCGAGSPQEQWLRQDLAANTADCTLAYWHHPLFSSAFDTAEVRPLFQALYDDHAEVALVGHAHNYERFAPQSPTGGLQRTRGVRQFVVGTGGRMLHGLGSAAPNSEARNDSSFGVLKLTLHASGYDWEFVPAAGSTYTDSGSDSCHEPAPDTQAPTAPTNLAASAPGPTQVNLSWTAASDDVAVTAYDIARNGVPLASVGAVTAYSDTTVMPGTTYTYEIRARDAAENVSAPSNAATVTTPLPGTTTTVVFTAQADARVYEGSPGTNYASSYLRTDGGTDPEVESYLRFALSGLGAPVREATLRVYAYSSTSNGPAAYTGGDAWTETGLTWSNRPARSSAVLADKGAIATNTWVEYLVTPAVTGDGSYTFVLANQSTDGVYFNSREHATLKPQLVVTYG